MFAPLEGTDKRFRSPWRWLTARTRSKVSEWQDIRQFDSGKSQYSVETVETGERRLVPSGDAHVSATLRPQPSVENNVIAVIRSLDSTAEITNVLVFRKDASPPLKRMEIRIKDPKQVLATANALAATLRRSGVVCEAVRGARVPAHEIWLLLPRGHNATALMSCAELAEGNSGLEATYES